MNTARSLGVGAVLAAVVTGGTYAVFEPPAQLLVGIAAVYLAGGAVSAFRPAVWRVKGSKWAGLFAAVNTFGVLSLMNGLGPDPRFEAVVLGLGLGAFAYVCGAAMALDDMADGNDEPEPEPAPAD